MFNPIPATNHNMPNTRSLKNAKKDINSIQWQIMGICFVSFYINKPGEGKTNE